ncbi:MAG: hypothetical protein ACRCTX_22840 [Afipia sp.]
MSEFKPVETIEDLNCLDDDEIVEGYRAGLRGAPEPGTDKSRSYWHGWRNGSSDGGHRENDASQSKLADALYSPQRKMKMN